MNSRNRWVFAGLVVLLTASSWFENGADADELSATLEQPVTEVSHSVAVSLADGVATFRVQRVFANAGERADEAALEIDLPPGAAATGLRIRAGKRWYRGELMEREEAARMYQELTGMGPHEPKDPALLQWEWAGKLHLQIFPIMPGQTSTVEYTLTVPTSYQNGRYSVAYPKPSDLDKLARPVLQITPGHGDATTELRVDGRRVAPDAPVVLSPPAPLAWVGEGEPESGSGYVISTIEVADRGVAATARVDFAIDHTYRGDLSVTLVTPKGKHIELDGRGGGSKNDLRKQITVELPPGTPIQGKWHLVVGDHVGLDTGKLEKFALDLKPAAGAKNAKLVTATAVDTPLFIPDASDDDAGFAAIEIAPPPIRTVAARLGRVVASPEHGFLRLELDVAPELSSLPVKPSVVFVIDASHTMGQEAIDAQLILARAYLAHVPDARVEIVLFRRFAERLGNRFMSVGEVDEVLATARRSGRLAPGNGSAFDLGLRAAASALAGRPGPQRVVVLSDALLRSAYSNKKALRALAGARKAIVHVVIPGFDTDKPAESRDDSHALAPVAAARRGVLLEMTGLGDKTPAALRGVVLGLVRPIRIDNVTIAGVDMSSAGEPPKTLGEGTGYRAMLKLAKPPHKLTVRGQIWGDSYRKAIRKDAGFSRATAAFVFGEDEHTDLSDDEMMVVARYGRAVSPVTSYLAIEPGVRPSRIGIARGMLSGSGIGMGYGSAAAYGGAALAPPDMNRYMATGARRCLAKHKPGPKYHAKVWIETTYHEVVDVETTGSHEKLNRCLTEAAWALALPRSSFYQRRDSHTLTFNGTR